MAREQKHTNKEDEKFFFYSKVDSVWLIFKVLFWSGVAACILGVIVFLVSGILGWD